MAMNPKAGTPGAKATVRCENKIMAEPNIMIFVPRPTLSTTAPNSGAKTSVKKGIMATMTDATPLSMPKRGMSMAVANLRNETTQQ